MTRSLGKTLNDYNSLAVKNPETVQRAKDQIIREFIISSITKDWAVANNILVKKKDIEDEIQRLKSAYPDENSFKEAISKEDLSYDEWKRKVHFRVLQQLVLDELMKKAEPISNKEIKSYYDANIEEFKIPEQVKLRQVVVKTQIEIERLQEQLKKGEKLAAIAKKFSIAPESENEGLVGWVEKGSLEVFDKAFSMPKGRRSGIEKSPFGFHIFEVVDKTRPRTLKMSEVSEQIKQRIQANREQAVYSAWLESQLDVTKVRQDDKLIASIDVETRGSY